MGMLVIQIMGYALEFYSIDLKTLHTKLMLEKNFSNSALFHEISAILSKKSLKDKVALGQGAALELSNIVNQTGDFLGSLDHVNASGEYFRDVFIHGVAAHVFQEPQLLTYLAHRALFGLEIKFPDWGWMSHNELFHLRKNTNNTLSLENNLLEWLDDLETLLQDAIKKDRDLITMYV
jgi:hypothetical protein